jgi:hypothetical protein
MGDRELGARPRLAQPIGAGDDRREIRVYLAPGLIERPGRQPEIGRLPSSRWISSKAQRSKTASSCA